MTKAFRHRHVWCTAMYIMSYVAQLDAKGHVTPEILRVVGVRKSIFVIYFKFRSIDKGDMHTCCWLARAFLNF
jgi:hypothetical protein